jgi:hypothetical protein
MRQSYVAGEKLFVDYGQTVPLTDPETAEIKAAQVFVAVLGASSYTYAEATMMQSLPDWLGSHVRAFRFFGGLPAIVVPDNLRSGVSKPCRYEPQLNPSHAELANHYNVAVIPARVRKPKDKAKAEAGIQLVQRWILAALRHRTFFSLDEINEAVAGLLTKLNAKPFKKVSGSRAGLFAELDKPALRPLPLIHYQYAEWRPVRLGPQGGATSAECELWGETVNSWAKKNGLHQREVVDLIEGKLKGTKGVPMETRLKMEECFGSIFSSAD